MNKKTINIIFMGTSDFAVPILKHIILYNLSFQKEEGNQNRSKSRYNIIAVYTKPPIEAGRGMRQTKSPIHILAEEFGLKVITPTTFKIEENVQEFKNLSPDIVIVASYGLILRQALLDIPQYGCINVHPSSLPRWRGAAPIQRTLMAGDKTTSVCAIQMDAGLDTGPIILREDFVINDKINDKIKENGFLENDLNTEVLSNITSDIGGKMILNILNIIYCNQTYKSYKQAEEGVTYAEKITKEEELIDWNKIADDILYKIRALSPKPGAYFIHNNNVIKILKAKVVVVKTNDISQYSLIGNIFGSVTEKHDNESNEFNESNDILKVGDILRLHNVNNKNNYYKPNNLEIGIVCSQNTVLVPLVVQKSGSKPMDFKTFINGYRFFMYEKM